MSSFRVAWEIQVDANTPLQAAIKALEIQQDAFSEDIFYRVTDESTGVETEVDLLNEENP